jgi:NAD(P)-dependent dehydrogenase (short-subunit alcohol dehydrogenase family)
MVVNFPGRFANKLVAVTGGASGLGAAMVKRYVSDGARVCVADMNRKSGEEFCSQFPKDTAFFHECDIGTPEGAESVVTAAVKHLGGLDILHNNASAFAWGSVEEIDPKNWDRVFRVGIHGPFY